MRVIHFTEGAGDSLWGRGGKGVGFVPLLEGEYGTLIGCLHLAGGAVLDRAVHESACALLVVQGEATLVTPCCIALGGGVGILMERGERFRLESVRGAIIIMVECYELEATEIAISTPDRIRGQRWPGET